jgi:uncharacterized protein (TIGR02453 family)
VAGPEPGHPSLAGTEVPPTRESAASTFAGYPPDAFVFLRDLAAHNEKPWFEANRPTYDRAVKAPSAVLVTAVAEALRARDLPLEGEPKRSGFRIHRDTRFSKSKVPYKTAVGTVWYRQGSGKDGAGVLYFHLVPDGCFVAAAFYMPDPEVLGAIRERIRVQPERYLAMSHSLRDRGLTLAAGDSLSRMPRGFEDLAASPVASAIKLKSYLVSRPVSNAAAQSPALVTAIVDLAADALPLLQFGWAAVDEARTA